MIKKKIRLLNAKKQEFGSITWTSGGEISALTVEKDSELTKQMVSFLKEIAEEKGLSVLKTEKKAINNGEASDTAIIEKKTTVATTDELFPAALVTAINKKRNWVERIFAVLESDK